MSLLRFLGFAKEKTPEAGETSSVRRIAAQLERLEPDTAKYLAGFSYVLARIAHADLEIDDHETSEMRRIVGQLASLSSDEADLVVEIAKSQARLLGGTENYVVTREFRQVSSREQRAQLLSCLFAVAAADGSISASESQEIASIADELGFTRQEANALRARYRDKLSVFQSGSD